MGVEFKKRYKIHCANRNEKMVKNLLDMIEKCIRQESHPSYRPSDDGRDQVMYIRIDPELKAKFKAYCARIDKTMELVIREMMESQIRLDGPLHAS